MNVGRQLLAEYVRTGSEAAFRELVDRYLNLVHHTARRLVGGDEHRAQDIAQIVFANLARQAAELTPEVQLGGWLHRHTCFVAANQLRGERRRIAREIEAANMNLESDVKPDDFARLAPLLDATINQLPEADRTAIVLRYFEQKDFRSIGQTLAVSDDAARARVNRALDKLQDLLTKQGIPTTAAALGVVLTTQAVTAAPAGLAALITASALAGSSSAAATTLLATTKILAMTTLQKACLTLTVATLAGVGLYEARQAAVWHAQATALQAQLSPLRTQITAQQKQLAMLANGPEATAYLAPPGTPTPDNRELLRLRGEVTRLRQEAQQTDDPIVKKALLWSANVAKMKQLFADHPDQQVPELKLLSEAYFFDLARDQDLESSNGVRRAFSEIRMRAKNAFAPELQKALNRYVNANQDQLPGHVTDLKSYFPAPVDDAMLDQYQMISSGPASQLNGAYALQEKHVIDPEYDDMWQISPDGFRPRAVGAADAGMQAILDNLKPAIESFMTANQGRPPAHLTDLKAYLNTPEQQKAYTAAVNSGATIGFPQ